MSIKKRITVSQGNCLSDMPQPEPIFGAFHKEVESLTRRMEAAGLLVHLSVAAPAEILTAEYSEENHGTPCHQYVFNNAGAMDDQEYPYVEGYKGATNKQKSTIRSLNEDFLTLRLIGEGVFSAIPTEIYENPIVKRAVMGVAAMLRPDGPHGECTCDDCTADREKAKEEGEEAEPQINGGCLLCNSPDGGGCEIHGVEAKEKTI